MFECLLKWFLFWCSLVLFGNVLLYEWIGFSMDICLCTVMSNDMCIYVAVQMLMSVRRSTGDASKRVSTHLALITVSAAKASACTLMAGPALVSSKQKYLLHLAVTIFKAFLLLHTLCIFPSLILMGICKHVFSGLEEYNAEDTEVH